MRLYTQSMNEQTTPKMKAVCKQSKICHNRSQQTIEFNKIVVN